MRSTAIANAAAMEIVRFLTADAAARLAEQQAEQDVLGWRKQVAEFMTASGSRCLLEHVTDEQWMRHYAANEDAYTAVVAELEKVE